jgi:hypothetical protein
MSYRNKIKSDRLLRDMMNQKEKSILESANMVNIRRQEKIVTLRSKLGVSSIKLDQMTDGIQSSATIDAYKKGLELKKALLLQKNQKKTEEYKYSLLDPSLISIESSFKVQNEHKLNSKTGYAKIVSESDSNIYMNKEDLGLVVKKINLQNVRSKNKSLSQILNKSSSKDKLDQTYSIRKRRKRISNTIKPKASDNQRSFSNNPIACITSTEKPKFSEIIIQKHKKASTNRSFRTIDDQNEGTKIVNILGKTYNVLEEINTARKLAQSLAYGVPVNNVEI